MATTMNGFRSQWATQRHKVKIPVFGVMVMLALWHPWDQPPPYVTSGTLDCVRGPGDGDSLECATVSPSGGFGGTRVVLSIGRGDCLKVRGEQFWLPVSAPEGACTLRVQLRVQEPDE